MGIKFGEEDGFALNGFSMAFLASSVSSLFVTLLRVFRLVFLRFISLEFSKMNNENNIVEANKDEPSSEISDFKVLEEETSMKEESFGFTFKFPSYDDFTKSQTESTVSKLIISLEQPTSSVQNIDDFHSATKALSFVAEESDPSSFAINEQDRNDKAQSEFLSEKDFEISQPKHDEFQSSDSDSDSDSDSITSSHEFSFMSHDFLSDTDFESSKANENDNVEETDEDVLEELRKLKGQGSEKSPPESSALETLWEHQDLLEQLKMELKKVRATGLPTILEDSESPKISEDLKPWKIEDKVHRGDKLSELHKFYKSYRERMRKFDILNYQKMYALGFLQSKDPLKSLSNSKSSTIWGYKRNKKLQSSCDQMVNFVRELQGDLEIVYVGQLCLSWEFLQWQYEKAFEIWESDPHGFRQYNEVAGEFQQFQVLLNRFIENEPFQGRPRVENYVKNRCVMRNLLHVPVIREDSKERRKARRCRDNDTITSDMLFEILEESIRTIWRFIRADKYAHNTAPKCCKGKEIQLQDPQDSDLFLRVQTELKKKDKKLKERLRSGNCIVKRFQKKHEDDGSDHLQFFSQVDMRLVTRVLNMSRITTDQLVWCHNKLTKINFVKRKINVEPSFLLFPC